MLLPGRSPGTAGTVVFHRISFKGVAPSDNNVPEVVSNPVFWLNGTMIAQEADEKLTSTATTNNTLKTFFIFFPFFLLKLLFDYLKI